MALSLKPQALLKNRTALTLIRSTLTAVGISFLLSALALYLFDITELTRLELLVLAFTLPAVITPMIGWQHAQRSVIIESMQEEIKEASRHDDATGLLSKRAFLELAQKELLLASRHGYPITLVSLGLDAFDELKTKYSRMLADHTFRSCGQLLKASLRETDTLARYGEESFILLMPHTDLEHAKEVIIRLQTQIRQSPIRLERQEINISLSAGISSVQTNYSLETLTANAERALARAKSQGVNQLDIFSEPVTVKLDSSSNTA